MCRCRSRASSSLDLLESTIFCFSHIPFTDSLVVLGYISNQTRHFSKFVSRRVALILRLTDAERWLYIPTKLNPADIASRPQTPETLTNNIWFSGPLKLAETDYHPVHQPSQQLELPEEVKEEKSLKTRAERSSDPHLLFHAMRRAASWKSLLMTGATLLKLRYFLDKARQRLGISLAPRDTLISVRHLLLSVFLLYKMHRSLMNVSYC